MGIYYGIWLGNEAYSNKWGEADFRRYSDRSVRELDQMVSPDSDNAGDIRFLGWDKAQKMENRTHPYRA